MKIDLIQNLTDTFEAHAQETEDGVEFWLARDLQHLLGYTAHPSVASSLKRLFNKVISDHMLAYKCITIRHLTLDATLGRKGEIVISRFNNKRTYICCCK